MNKEQLQQDIEVMEQRLASMKAELNKKPVSKVFIPKNGCDYFFIGADGSLIQTLLTNDNCDNHRFAIGNFYHTREDAEKALAKQLACVRVTRKLRELEGDWVADWSDNSQAKYIISSINKASKFIVDYWLDSKMADNAMYSTQEACQWVIDNMAADLKLIFEVE